MSSHQQSAGQLPEAFFVFFMGHNCKYLFVRMSLTHLSRLIDSSGELNEKKKKGCAMSLKPMTAVLVVTSL